MTMRALPWIIGGGATALAVYYWTGKRGRPVAGHTDDNSASSEPTDERSKHGPSSSSAGADATPARLPGRWVWPLGIWRDRKPEISDGFSSKRRSPTGTLITHGGVDMMYRRRAGDPWRAGTPNGSPGWIMPDHRAALAASDGVVWSAANTQRGWTVVLDHSPRKLATYYTHLSSLLVGAKQSVSAGTPLGIIGADPLDGEHLMHLHFEIWRGGPGDRFDPQRLIETTWEYLRDPGDLPHDLVA
jgi:murein DD-endopeptidase MepM/ murein hydrolase activator NlpD